MKIVLQILIFGILTINCRSNKLYEIPEFTSISPEQTQEFKRLLNFYTKIDSLKKTNSIFLAYKKYSIGAIPRIINSKDDNNCNSCIDDNFIYLIWKQNNSSFIQKYNNCGSYCRIKLNNNEILDDLYENFEIIKNEKIKIYLINKNAFSSISHSTFKEFLFYKSGIEVYNHFDTFNLTTNIEYPNINAEYNQNLKLILLNKKIDYEIEKLENSKMFNRTRCYK